jgi:hypothetical protein
VHHAVFADRNRMRIDKETEVGGRTDVETGQVLWLGRFGHDRHDFDEFFFDVRAADNFIEQSGVREPWPGHAQ